MHIIANSKILEQVRSFNLTTTCLISSYNYINKLFKYQQFIGTTKRSLLTKVGTETIQKFDKTLIITLLH